jgi:hypothetical protein
MVAEGVSTVEVGSTVVGTDKSKLA